MTDPTPADIEAGAEAFAEEALDSAGRWTDRATPREVATAVLRAVLPDHDARLRAETWRHAAQSIRDRLGRVGGRDRLSYQNGASDAARLLDNFADDLARIRRTLTGGDRD